jgi:hypothetical protein
MSFLPCPLHQDLSSNSGFVFTEGDSLGIEPNIDGFGNPETKVFKRDAHAAELDFLGYRSGSTRSFPLVTAWILYADPSGMTSGHWLTACRVFPMAFAALLTDPKNRTTSTFRMAGL